MHSISLRTSVALGAIVLVIGSASGCTGSSDRVVAEGPVTTVPGTATSAPFTPPTGSAPTIVDGALSGGVPPHRWAVSLRQENALGVEGPCIAAVWADAQVAGPADCGAALIGRFVVMSESPSVDGETILVAGLVAPEVTEVRVGPPGADVVAATSGSLFAVALPAGAVPVTQGSYTVDGVSTECTNLLEAGPSEPVPLPAGDDPVVGGSFVPSAFVCG